jgi:hypothetical protein
MFSLQHLKLKELLEKQTGHIQLPQPPRSALQHYSGFRDFLHIWSEPPAHFHHSGTYPWNFVGNSLKLNYDALERNAYNNGLDRKKFKLVVDQYHNAY